jgi:hypothetical protein
VGDEPYSVLALTLPAEFFPDEDDIARKAGVHVATRLGNHLAERGHSIPDWVRGGCEEDACVYLESEREGVRYDYVIVFFGREAGRGSDCRWMAVQYGTRVGLWARLWSRQPQLRVDDPIHEVLREFGATHERFELLTQSEFRKEY